MKEPNDFIAKIVAAADQNGWIVVQWELQSPGWVTLQDANGTKVRIDSPHGIDLPHYVEQFKARTK